MDSIKISLFLFLALSSFHNSECRTLPKYSVPKDPLVNSDKNSCFCFANAGDFSKVPEILKPDGGLKRLERLVVYLYKDKDTNDVKMYLPNDEKQVLIPDLAFEVGDKLIPVVGKSFIDIFDVKSHGLVVNPDSLDIIHRLPLKSPPVQHGTDRDSFEIPPGTPKEKQSLPHSSLDSLHQWSPPSKPHSSPHSTSQSNPHLVLDEKHNNQPGRWLPDQPGTWLPGQPSTWLPGQPGKWLPGKTGTWLPDQPGILPPDQPGTLSPDQPGTLPSDQPDKLLTDKPVTLLPVQPNKSLPEDTGGWLPDQPGTLPSDQLDRLLPDQPGKLLPDQPVTLLPDQSSKLLTDQSGGLLPDKPGTLPSDQSNKLLPEQSGGLLPDQPGKLLPDLPGTLLPDQPNKLLLDQSGILLPDQPGTWLPDQPSAWLPDQPGRLLPDQSGTLLPVQPNKLLPDQSGRLLPEQPGKWLPGQPGTWLPGQPGTWLPNQPGRLLPNQPGELPLDKSGRLLPDQQGKLLPDQPDKLLPDQPDRLLPEQSGKLLPDQPETLPSDKPGRLLPDQPGKLLPDRPHQQSDIKPSQTSTEAVSNIQDHTVKPETDEYDIIEIQWEIPNKEELLHVLDDKSEEKTNTHDSSPYDSEAGSYHPIKGIESVEKPEAESPENEYSKSAKSGGEPTEENPSSENKTKDTTSDEDINRAALDSIFDNQLSPISKPNKNVHSDKLDNVDLTDSNDSHDEMDISEVIQFPDQVLPNEKRVPYKENKAYEESFSIEEIMRPVNHHHKNNYETFDRWFIRQMLRFKVYKEHDSAVNISAIEQYMLKILQDNDMLVTSEGVLTDRFGTVLDVNNLHLRPILIGNSMAIKNILDDKQQELILPVDLPYLQAILVTNASPPIILGIIPIGKTIIPPSAANAFSSILKKTFAPVQHTGNILSDGKTNIGFDYIQKLVKDNKPMLNHLSGSTLAAPKLSVNNKNGGTRNTVFTVVKDTPLILNGHPSHRPAGTVKVYDSKSNEILLEGNAIDVVNKLFNTFRPDDKITKKVVVVANDVNNEVNEDDIAGRIVGGSAATGSGTPLSIKGRMKDF